MELLVQSLLESHDQLVLVMAQEQPAFANRLFLDFFGLGSSRYAYALKMVLPEGKEPLPAMIKRALS